MMYVCNYIYVRFIYVHILSITNNQQHNRALAVAEIKKTVDTLLNISKLKN